MTVCLYPFWIRSPERENIEAEREEAEDIHLVPFSDGVGLAEERRLAASVEEHCGLAATRRGLALRLASAKLVEARALLHNEKGAGASIVEIGLWEVKGHPAALDKGEVQEWLAKIGWRARAQALFHGERFRGLGRWGGGRPRRRQLCSAG